MFFLEMLKIFRRATLRNNIFIAIILNFFITYFVNFISKIAKLNIYKGILAEAYKDLRCSFFWK